MRGWRKNNTKLLRPQRTKKGRILLHPLFFAVGIIYSILGELPLFLMSCLVAIEHECAHAFAAQKLGYKLNRIVLMPYGAIIDGDLKGIGIKDELIVAISGPLCNLCTALFFVAVWWFYPTAYAYTDTAYYSSLAIALVNLLPAYPLDGGRIFQCLLENALLKTRKFALSAETYARKISRGVTLFFALFLEFLFFFSLAHDKVFFSLFIFGAFLFFSAFGNKNNPIAYEKIDFSYKDALARGVVLKKVAVLASCPIKNAFKYLSRGAYLVLCVYDESGNFLFEIPQNQLNAMFISAPSPLTSLSSLYKKAQNLLKNE